MNNYEIFVKRTDTSISLGELEFYINKELIFTCRCYEDPDNLVTPGLYEQNSATYMASPDDDGNKRMGIYLKDAFSNKSGEHSIFIYRGNSPNASDGCIVIAEEQMLHLWNSIDPKDGQNVKVNIANQYKEPT